MGSSLVRMPKTVTEKGSSCQPKRAQRKSNQEKKNLRHFRKKFVDNTEDKEGATYEADSI